MTGRERGETQHLGRGPARSATPKRPLGISISASPGIPRIGHQALFEQAQGSDCTHVANSPHEDDSKSFLFEQAKETDSRHPCISPRRAHEIHPNFFTLEQAKEKDFRRPVISPRRGQEVHSNSSFFEQSIATSPRVIRRGQDAHLNAVFHEQSKGTDCRNTLPSPRDIGRGHEAHSKSFQYEQHKDSDCRHIVPPVRDVRRDEGRAPPFPNPSQGSEKAIDSVKKILQQALSASEPSDESRLLGDIKTELEAFRSARSPRVSQANSHIPGTDSMNAEPSNIDCPSTESPTDAILSLQKLVAAVRVEIRILAENIVQTRMEMRTYSEKLCCDLEERLATQRMEQSTSETQASTFEASLTEQIQGLGKKYGFFNDMIDSRHDDAVRPLDIAMYPTTSPIECGSPEDEPEQNAQLVNRISDLVIARVNADPRICQLAQSHQSIQESFTKLLEMMQKAPWIERESQADKDSLHDAVIETQKNCKSLSLELRHLRQRRNQDCSEAAVRFVKLEESLQDIEGKLVSMGGLTAAERSEANRTRGAAERLEALRTRIDAVMDAPSTALGLL